MCPEAYDLYLSTASRSGLSDEVKGLFRLAQKGYAV